MRTAKFSVWYLGSRLYDADVKIVVAATYVFNGGL
jgi:hypothetical protein